MHSIDVLMTAYNAGTTIRLAILSLLSQDMADFQIIVVDDGSTDETPDVLSALAEKDSRITIVRQSNQGIVAAANAGLARCTAEFVARLDADDISFPTRFRTQLEYLRAVPECVAISCLAFHIDVKGRRIGTIAGQYSAAATDATAIPAREPYIMHPFVMFRRSALVAAGGYRHVDLAEDADLYWRLLGLGTLHVLDEVLGEYRVHQGSITGLSILNGRISAMNSQLSAISERRRKAGATDLQFTCRDFGLWCEAKEIEIMLELARPKLDASEFHHLCLAMPAKLLELSSYRPYSLEFNDCKAIRNLLRKDARVLANTPSLKKLWGGACARLVRRGQFRCAWVLFDRAVLAETLLSIVKQSLRSILGTGNFQGARHRFGKRNGYRFKQVG